MRQENGLEEDFCANCLNIVYNVEQFEPRTYTFEDICDEFYVPETYNE